MKKGGLEAQQWSNSANKINRDKQLTFSFIYKIVMIKNIFHCTEAQVWFLYWYWSIFCLKKKNLFLVWNVSLQFYYLNLLLKNKIF